VDVGELKKQAAEYAVDHFVESGMVLGLGTGTTAVWAVRRVAARLADGTLTDIVGVPTSKRTAEAARESGIPLATLDEQPEIDLTFDGADEIDPSLDLINGGGGALLREKVVAQVSKQMIVVADVGKRVEQLGTTYKLPVEVIPFGLRPVERAIEALSGQPFLRRTDDGQPYVTDNGNYIFDVAFDGGIADAGALAAALDALGGVMAQGLFLGLATRAVVASETGVEVLQRP